MMHKPTLEELGSLAAEYRAYVMADEAPPEYLYHLFAMGLMETINGLAHQVLDLNIHLHTQNEILERIATALEVQIGG